MTERILKQRAFQNFISISRLKDDGWIGDLLFDGFKICARVMDQNLSEILSEGKGFEAGDALDVTIEINQRYIPSCHAFENIRFYVREFHKHIPTKN